MDNRAFQEFSEELEVAFELKGKPPLSDRALAMWFRLLSGYSLRDSLAALDSFTASSPYAPTPDRLIESMKALDGRPTAEEAWATALLSSNEAETIIWTDEIAQALSLGAGDLLADGDRTAARMAFRDSYNRLVNQSRESGASVNVWISQGHDAQRRDAAVEQAVAKGLISHERGKTLMIGKQAPINKPFLRLVKTATSEKDTSKRLAMLKKMKQGLN